MVTLTKQQVIAKIRNIAGMNLVELEEFGVKVSLSDVDDKAKYFLYKAIDCRKMELKENTTDSFMVNGDLDDMELE